MEHSKDSQIQQSSSQNLYEFESSEEGYVFKTETGAEYVVTFLDYNSMFEDMPIQVYHLAFYKTRKGSEKEKDGERRSNIEANKVRNTIIHIVTVFFEEHERAIISFCETEDGQQFSRQRLFNLWYSKYRDIISREEVVFAISEDLQTYAALYYRKDDLCAKDLAEQFKELAKVNFYHN